MKLKYLFVLCMAPLLSFGQDKKTQNDENGKKPDISKISIDDIKWKKSEGNAFWFYYKPSMYFFQDKEFETIPLENGDYVVYVYDLDKYLLLPSYHDTEQNIEKGVTLAANRSCIFIRLKQDRFWIFDHGHYVNSLQRIANGTSDTYHQVIYRSGLSDKRYFIDERDFFYGPISTVIGILSE